MKPRDVREEPRLPQPRPRPAELIIVRRAAAGGFRSQKGY